MTSIPQWQPFCSPAELRRDYELTMMSLEEIAKKWGVSRKRVRTSMIKCGIARRRQIKRNQQGEKNTSWKGEAIGYKGAHQRVAYVRGKPSRCERCGSVDARRYEWANLTGLYHDPKDYVRLCVPCHRKYDMRSQCRNGHPYNPSNIYIWNGKRYCRECRRIIGARRYLAETEVGTCDTCGKPDCGPAHKLAF